MILPLLGIVLTMVLVFGGYIMAGGKIEIILHALPHELPMLGGATIGAWLLASPMTTVKLTGKAIGLTFKGSKWKAQDYKDILCLMFMLSKLMRTKGMMAVEQHIENPSSSSLFSQFPKIQHDHFACDFICDTLRMMTMALDDPHQVEDLMEKQLEKHHHEALKGSEAIQTMADGLPAIGIVVAVLGVIKTMASIDQPPPILGAMIGGALVGTFMGVFLAYCFFAPMANKSKAAVDEDGQFYRIIRDVLVAHLHGNAPQISVEMGRAEVPSHIQPTFQEMEQLLSTLKVE